jgi:hypothetical protein
MVRKNSYTYVVEKMAGRKSSEVSPGSHSREIGEYICAKYRVSAESPVPFNVLCALVEVIKCDKNVLRNSEVRKQNQSGVWSYPGTASVRGDPFPGSDSHGCPPCVLDIGIKATRFWSARLSQDERNVRQ